MGCEPMFCCFKKFNSKAINIAAIVINSVAVVLIIWGVAYMVWYSKAAKALYLIPFIFLILTLITFIGTLIIVIKKIDTKIAKYISIAILILCGLAFIFLFVVEIIIIKDYVEADNLKGDYGLIPTHRWITAIFPGLISLIVIVHLALCANILFKLFSENIEALDSDNQKTFPQTNIQIQNTTTDTTNSNLNQTGINTLNQMEVNTNSGGISELNPVTTTNINPTNTPYGNYQQQNPV